MQKGNLLLDYCSKLTQKSSDILKSFQIYFFVFLFFSVFNFWKAYRIHHCNTITQIIIAEHSTQFENQLTYIHF